MVSPLVMRVGDLRRLQRLHLVRDAINRDDLSRRLGRRRAVYYWLRRIRGQVTFAPRIAFGSLGLIHAHLFIRRATVDWLRFPYAIDRAWTIKHPGNDVLYLHCLVPREHLDRLPHGRGITAITSTDGWQHLALIRSNDRSGQSSENPRLEVEPPERHANLVSQIPFLLPVACELSQGGSVDEQWERIMRHLGKQLLAFLPRSRRSRHGRDLLRHAFATINAHGLVLQHTVKLQALRAQTIELFVLAKNTTLVREAIASLAPSMEAYRSGKDCLFRVEGDLALIKRIITTPGIHAWWFVDHERTKALPAVRFAYERLYDPRAKHWVAP